MWLRLLAGGFVTGGVVMALGVLANVGTGLHAPAALAGALVLVGVAPIGLGGWLLAIERRRTRALAARKDVEDEMGLVRLAAERGGSLTVAEVAAVTGVEPARAERLLDGLCQRGLAEHRIAEDGSLVYRMRPLLGAAEKARAKGVLDARFRQAALTDHEQGSRELLPGPARRDDLRRPCQNRTAMSRSLVCSGATKPQLPPTTWSCRRNTAASTIIDSTPSASPVMLYVWATPLPGECRAGMRRCRTSFGARCCRRTWASPRPPAERAPTGSHGSAPPEAKRPKLPPRWRPSQSFVLRPIPRSTR